MLPVMTIRAYMPPSITCASGNPCTAPAHGMPRCGCGVFRSKSTRSISTPSSKRGRRHEQPTAYDDFFPGFGFGFAAGLTLDENSPTCGGFGLPRILMLLFALGYLLF